MLGLGLMGLPRYPLRMLKAHSEGDPEPRPDTPFGVFPGMGTVSRVAAKFVRDGVDRPDLIAPKTKFSGRISPHRRFAFGQLQLERLQGGQEQARRRPSTTSW